MRVLEHYRPAKADAGGAPPLISVIVTAYNIEAYIEKGVKSVCGQTYGNLEVIVVDDGSKDRTGVICDRLAKEDGRVRIIHKENGGPAEARNVALLQAGGEFIGFVDGDDWIDADMYEKMLGALLEQQADIAICRYRQVSKTHTEDFSVDRAIVFDGQEALQYYIEEKEEYPIQNAAWNKLYRKEILENLTFPAGKWYEDIMFATMALSRAKRCVYLDTAYYNYIIDREGSIMNTQINPRTFTDQIPAYYEKTKFLRGLGRQDLADIHDYFFYKRLLIFYAQLKLKKNGIENQAAYLEEIRKILYDNKEHVKNVFHCRTADARDRKMAFTFLESPERYVRKVRREEEIIIPLKVKIKSYLKIGNN